MSRKSEGPQDQLVNYLQPAMDTLSTKLDIAEVRGKHRPWVSPQYLTWFSDSLPLPRYWSLPNSWSMPCRTPTCLLSPGIVCWRISFSTGQNSSASSNWDTTSGLESWCSAQGKRNSTWGSLCSDKKKNAVLVQYTQSVASLLLRHKKTLDLPTTITYPSLLYDFLDSLENRNGWGEGMTVWESFCFLA